jgi:hypothetical protein
MNEKTWEQTEGWVGADLEDSFVLLSVNGGEYISLNSTAKEIWNAIETPTSQAQIVVHLRDRFDVDEQMSRRAVDRTLAHLIERGLARSAN